MAAPRRSIRELVPLFILIGGLAVSAAGAVWARRAAATAEGLRFENIVDVVQRTTESKLDAYKAMLRGTAGLFAASDEVRADEFAAFVRELDLKRRYPGVQGIGFSRFIRAGERRSAEAWLRSQGLSFSLWPDAAGEDLHAVVFLEPLDARNTHALGYNMWSDATRRDAMERARDTGLAAASAPVRLVQEDAEPKEEEQRGFLIYLPVFARPAPSTLDERRSRLLGFVYSPFRAGDLLGDIVDQRWRELARFEVYDGGIEPASLLYSSAPQPSEPPLHVEDRPIDVGGRTWHVRVSSGSRLNGGAPRRASNFIGGFGLLVTMLLFWVTRTQVRARAHAERATEELRRSEDVLRAANQAKDDFLAVVSHELRTPLNAILGWATMLRNRQLTPEREGYALEVIERNAMAQARLVDDLLDVSRAIAGRLRLQVVLTEVAPILRAALDAVKPLATERKIRFEFRADGPLGTIKADPARLQQVFWNLLTNAVKFTPEGGVVRLEASRQSDALVVKVIDNGIGISPEFLPHMFDRFQQADTSTTRPHSGVGLGLAIARHMVELHGGTISAESAGEGQGSTFTVVVPVSY
jgi:signal transduction histidine kinase